LWLLVPLFDQIFTRTSLVIPMSNNGPTYPHHWAAHVKH
jgi:hypothetical protein